MKGESQVNAVILLGPLFIGIAMATVVPAAVDRPEPFFRRSAAISGAGLVLFCIAKWSSIRDGRLLSFGSAEMTRANRIAYRLGYLLMGAGAFGTLVWLRMNG